MAFLKINNITVPVVNRSVKVGFDEPTSYTRSESGALTTSRRYKRAVISAETIPLTIEEANCLEGILSSLGHVWYFRDSMYSEVKGLGPKVASGYLRAAIDKTISPYASSSLDGVLRFPTLAGGEDIIFHSNLLTDWTVGVRFRDAASATFNSAGAYGSGVFDVTDTMRYGTAGGYLFSWTIADGASDVPDYVDVTSAGKFRLLANTSVDICFFDAFCYPFKFTTGYLDEMMSVPMTFPAPPPFVGVSGDLVDDLVAAGQTSITPTQTQANFLTCKPMLKNRTILQASSDGHKNNMSSLIFELIEQPLDMFAEGIP